MFTYFGFICYAVYFYFALGIEVFRLIQSGFLAITLVDLGRVFLTISDTQLSVTGCLDRPSWWLPFPFNCLFLLVFVCVSIFVYFYFRAL